jgi:hypothetical protein
MTWMGLVNHLDPGDLGAIPADYRKVRRAIVEESWCPPSRGEAVRVVKTAWPHY